MSNAPITHQLLSDAFSCVLPTIIEKLQPHYDPPEPLDDFARDVLGYTEESSLKEHIEFYDRHWSGELRGLLTTVSMALDTGEGTFKQRLIEWLTFDRTGCSPLSWGQLKYLLANALVDELGIRGEISQHLPREGTRTP